MITGNPANRPARNDAAHAEDHHQRRGGGCRHGDAPAAARRPERIRPPELGPATSSEGITLVDNTGLLTVTVPVDWIDQDPGYTSHDDGRPRPTILASPNIDALIRSWTTPGLHLLALPPTTDPAAALIEVNVGRACVDAGTVPYNDGRFAAYLQTWSSYGGTATRRVHLAARPVDNSFTMLLQIQVTTSDDAIVNRVVQVAVAPADDSALLFLAIQLPTTDDTALTTILASFRQL